MIPSAFVSLHLALAAYRLCRLVGWDDFPPIARARNWATGAETWTRGSVNARASGVAGEQVQEVTRYRRPLLEHWLHCPFCVGFWICVALYVWWLYSPATCLYAMAPFSLNAACGLIARNLDP